VASGFDDGTVRVWNVQTGTAQGDFTTGLVDDVRSFAFIANRDLVLGGLDGNLRVWDAETGKVETVLELKIGMIFSVAVMADEASATICAQRGVQVWDFKSKRLLRELVRSVPGFRAFLAFSSNDTYLVAGPYDGVIQLWDSATGTIQGTIRFDHYVWSMAISSDGRKVAISTTARVYLWNADVQPFATALTHLKSRITTVKVSHCQQWIATGANDGTLGVWDRKTGSIVRILRGHNNNVHSVVISRSGSRLLSGSMEQIRIWEVATWTTMRVLESGSRVVGLALSIDEKKVFSATEDGTICIWDADTGVLIKSTNTQTTPVSLTSFSPDGQLVSWAYSGKVETRSIETGELVQIHSRGRPYVGDLALSPNGQHLAIGSMGDIITIRQVQTNILQQTVRGASRKIDFGDDGSTIITNKARIALDWSLPQGSKADANWQGYGVDKNGEWVTWNGRRLLRLPAECSYGESAVTDQFIVLPYEATRIIILEFAEGVNPFRDR
jgi:WD40 repeat protein